MNIHVPQYRFVIGLLTVQVLLAGVLAASVQAQGNPIFRVQNMQPTRFRDIQQVVDPQRGQLTRKLNIIQCGGWDWDQNVVGLFNDDEGKISRVRGVPGRGTDPFGNILSGLGERFDRESDDIPDGEEGLLEDGFVYPKNEHAKGYSTLCSFAEMSRRRFPRAQRINNCQDPEKCFDLCVQLNYWHRAVCVQTSIETGARRIVNREECRLNTAERDPFARKRDGRPCSTTREDLEEGFRYSAMWTYCCSGQPVTEYDYEAKPDRRHADRMRNCVQCTGDGAAFAGEEEDFNGEPIRTSAGRNEIGCRWGGTIGAAEIEPVPVPPNTEVLPRPPFRQYRSFFRMYKTEYCRDPVKERPGGRDEQSQVACNERGRNNDWTACYGLYDEYDPKKVRTTVNDHRCVAALPRERFKDNNFKGKFGREDVEDPEPFSRRRPFNEGEDIWNPELSDAFSLLSGTALTNKFDDDLTDPLLNLDTAHLRSSPQLNEEQIFSTGALLRAFDDTVRNETEDERVFVEWWQRLQTEMHKYFTPPVVRLRLPALPALLGSDAFERFLASVSEDEDIGIAGGAASPHLFLEPVEVQLQVREDLLGEVSELLLSSSLFNLEEFPIPVVVPMISPTELAALEQQWCVRHMREEEADNCDGAPDVVDQLRNYQEQIDNVRKLRAELAMFAGQLLSSQNEVFEAISVWNEQVRAEYGAYLQAYGTRLNRTRIWQRVQDQYRKVHDQAMMPWCHNERYTTPIYSLLDPWLPSRLSNDNDDPATPVRIEVEISDLDLPDITVQRLPDVVLDFSLLQLDQLPLKVPVLKPIQVRVDTLALSPGLSEDPPDLPDLPEVPTLEDALNVDFLEPDTDPDTLPSISTFIQINDVPNIVSELNKARRLFTRMEQTYKTFWGGTNFGDIDENCRWGNFESCEHLRCQRFNLGRCVHTEPDLEERWRRLTSRPGLILPEDLESRGEQRRVDVVADDPADIIFECPKGDFACQPLNPQRTYAKMGWTVSVPEDAADAFNESLQQVRVDILRQTIPDEEEEVQLYTADPKEILRAYYIPDAIDLIPDPTSAPPDDSNSNP